MSTFLNTVLPIVGRVIAGGVGSFAFGIALFMYEDERGRWQSRLEDVWRSIYLRADSTDSVFTALMNRVANLLKRLFSRVFGEDKVSLKLFAVSINASQIGALCAKVWGGFGPHLTVFVIVLRDWQLLLIFIVITGIASLSRRKWVQVLCALPILLAIAQYIYFAADDVDFEIMSTYEALVALSSAIYPLALSISFATDILAVIVIRNIFLHLVEAPSVRGVISRTFALLGIAFAACPLPQLVSYFAIRSRKGAYVFSPGLPASFVLSTELGSLLRAIGIYNFITVIYALLPCVLLVLLLTHKIVWPLLARFTYPLKEFKVLSDRKYLVPIGTAAFGIAFRYATIAEFMTKWLKL